MRLIDADALKEDFEHATYGNTAVLVFDERLIGYINQVINNAPTVDLTEDFIVEYTTGYDDGLNKRPKGECENCDFRKFTETFVEGVVDLMNKNGITSFEQLSEILRGGADMRGET